MRIQFLRGSCPVTIITTGPPSPFLGVYYKGKRIWQDLDDGVEELDRILEVLPNQFRMVSRSTRDDLFSQEYPEEIPVWLVREEN